MIFNCTRVFFNRLKVSKGCVLQPRRNYGKLMLIERVKNGGEHLREVSETAGRFGGY